MTELRYGTAAEAGMSAGRIDLARDLCARWVKEDVHKALCVLVARRGVVCLHETFGNIGPHGAPPLQRDSIFPMASISKVTTATALMVLVEDGLVGLTRPVQEYIPEFEGEGKDQVLVHHLLTHTSGLREPFDVPTMLRSMGGYLGEEPESGHEALQRELLAALTAPLATKPGEEMFYSGQNFRLVGEIIRRASGCSVAEIAAARVFEPLRMRNTHYVLPDDAFDRTIGWGIFPPGLDPTITRAFRKTPSPDLGLFSTSSDMAAFAQMFLNGGRYGNARVLSPPTVAQMTRDQIPGIKATFAVFRDVEASWSYGWSIAGNAKWPGWPTFPRGTFSHSGAGAMLVWADPVHEIVGTYFSICRYGGTFEDPKPITNVDLFVNVVTAAAED